MQLSKITTIEERKSVLQAGPQIYLSEIQRLNNQQKSVLIIPGVQSSPFYYWKGNPFDEGLSAHNYRKELLLIGLSSSDDYYQLPLLHGGFSIRFVMDLLPRFMVFFAVFILSIYLIFQKGKHWDRILIDYCSGRRDHPIWAIAGSDFEEKN
jgi:hypothetical protein